MKFPIYLDYSSTTPVDRLVAKKMMQHLTINGVFGNTKSNHYYGWEAEEAVNIAKQHISDLINTSVSEIFFTSGATESNYSAIAKVAKIYCHKGKHIITGTTEHISVLNALKKLENNGFYITKLLPQKNGIIEPIQLENALSKNTILVSLMHVNNETGIIQDIYNFGKICKVNNITFHVDATQSIGKLDIDLSKLDVDLMSFSSHKIYGPKGIGCLFIRKQSSIEIEEDLSKKINFSFKTVPVHQIVGMGEAFRIALYFQKKDFLRTSFLKKKLKEGLKEINNVFINGCQKKCIPNILSVSFNHVYNSRLLINYLMQYLAISFGFVHTSSGFKQSHVLRSMGISKKLSYSTVRFSIGRFTTLEEIKFTIKKIRSIIKKLSIKNKKF